MQKDKIISFLFGFIFMYGIWAGLSIVFAWTAYDHILMDREFAAKVASGDCPAVNQYGNCWERKRYEDHLAGKDKVLPIFGFFH